MSETEIKEYEEDIGESTKESKKIKAIKLDKKKTIILLAAALILSPLIFGYASGFIKSTQIRNAQQGELIYYQLNENDITDSKMVDWIEENHKLKGIYVYEGDRPTDYKHVLLATGEQPFEDVKINIESVVGYEDKVLINGEVNPPSNDIVNNTTYPYLLLKIESINDPREIQLGTLNLYDVLRGVAIPIRVSLDNAIIREISGETIRIATFKNDENHPIYKLNEDSLREISEQNIKEGDLVSVSLNNDVSNGYPLIENIRRTTKVTEKIVISEILEEDQLLNIEVNGIPLTIKYSSDVKDKLNEVQLNNSYLVRLELVGEIVYLTNIII